MLFPHRCPICFGFRKVTWDPEHPPIDGIMPSTGGSWDCGTCAGTGIVWGEGEAEPGDAFGLKRLMKSTGVVREKR